ncbi:hypothetical protein DPMN_006797 [Dreissena polymorpha]|uniref:Uncharacterized protein n=1 Tax=Dreissena polymorpha TaxID=45954 RepID=A0A9D4MX76_DREPO|nr:hypothetical protein DPMN_006797 [Dreissena polymorpha]
MPDLEHSCRGWQSELRGEITLEGLWSFWHHWNGKETGVSKYLQVSRISLKIVMADQRTAVDSFSVSGRELISSASARQQDVVDTVETSNVGGLRLKERADAWNLSIVYIL